MVNFVYYSPTQVVFGKGAHLEAGRLARQQGAKRVLVHYGSRHAEESGLLKEICNCLEGEGLEYVLLGGVVPNPHLSLVYKGIDLCRSQGIDFILALGGGSVIDSAKAIGMGAPYQGDVWDFYGGKAEASQCLPIGSVLTIAAAGSELSNSSVITNTELGQKRGYGNDITRCRFALMNPELTISLPGYQTACGGVDIVMHTLERYLTPEQPMGITDEIARGLMRSAIASSRRLMRSPESYSARADLMWAGALSHNGLTGCGSGGGDWACHQIAHELGAKYNLAHGAALAAVWPSWARYVLGSPKNTQLAHAQERFESLAEFVLEAEADGYGKLYLGAVQEMENFFWSLEMPTCLEEAGIFPTEEEIDDMAEKCTKFGQRTVGGLLPLGKDDIAAVLRMAAEKDGGLE